MQRAVVVDGEPNVSVGDPFGQLNVIWSPLTEYVPLPSSVSPSPSRCLRCVVPSFIVMVNTHGNVARFSGVLSPAVPWARASSFVIVHR